MPCGAILISVGRGTSEKENEMDWCPHEKTYQGRCVDCREDLTGKNRPDPLDRTAYPMIRLRPVKAKKGDR